jgi:prolyl 4-hydroxylase
MSKNSQANRKLADIGKQTRRRLARESAVQSLAQGGLELFVAEQFLAPAECAALIARIDENARPSTLYTVDEASDFRTSYSCDLNPRDPAVIDIEARICTLTGIDQRHGETLQGQRYAVGQQFKPHHDHFPYEVDYWQAERLNGGQRSWTAMIYLNQPEGGGETNFPSAGLCIAPRAGMLLLWNNMLEDGSPNANSLHEGCPVSGGTKYIVTKWFRERFWAVGLR